MKKTALLIAFVMSLAVGAEAAIKTEAVEYKDGETLLEGYLAYDDAAKGKRPGIMVIHEWYGMGPYAKRRAEQLAKLGYVAFAADMYGKGVYAKDHEEAGKLAGAFRNDRALMRKRALAGLDVLAKRKEADAAKLAAIGYCFGGTAALETARAGADIKGAVAFHGGVDSPSPATAGAIKAKLIAFIGADDKRVVAGIPDFEEEMRKAKADYQIVLYGGAVHSFTVKEAGDDPSKGAAYNEAADRRSWQALQDFLKELF